MGLDMYLQARAFASEHYNPVGIFSSVDPILSKLPGGKNYYLSKEVAYWRKANAIHGWFVSNVQDGVDECQDSYVSLEKLTELRDLCVSLLASRDVERVKEELPPCDGFFFGGTEIDEYYWADLENTVQQIDAILAIPQVEKFALVYHSSW